MSIAQTKMTLMQVRKIVLCVFIRKRGQILCPSLLNSISKFFQAFALHCIALQEGRSKSTVNLGLSSVSSNNPKQNANSSCSSS